MQNRNVIQTEAGFAHLNLLHNTAMHTTFARRLLRNTAHKLKTEKTTSPAENHRTLARNIKRSYAGVFKNIRKIIAYFD